MREKRGVSLATRVFVGLGAGVLLGFFFGERVTWRKVLRALPAWMSRFTPKRSGTVFRRTRDALVTAFAAGSLLVVLPIRSEPSTALLRESVEGESALANSADIRVPASFDSPSAGILLSPLFGRLAAWFVGQPLDLTQYPLFLARDFASFFGNILMATPVLLNLQQIRSDLLQLFFARDVLGGRFGTLLAAMPTVAFALLGAYAMRGRLRIRWVKLSRVQLIKGFLLVALLGGARFAFSKLVKEEYTKDEALTWMPTLMRPQDAIVHRGKRPLPPSGGP